MRRQSKPRLQVDATKEIQKLRGLRQAVLWLCEKYPSVKGSYKKLVNYFWKYLDKLTTTCQWCGRETRVWIDDFSKLTPPESITRTYRHLVRNKRIKEPLEIKLSKIKLERIHRTYWGS